MFGSPGSDINRIAGAKEAQADVCEDIAAEREAAS
jgi:hypothetical protein